MPQSSKHIDDQPGFDQRQYDFLKQCSEKLDEGIKQWNEWRLKHLVPAHD